MLLVQSFLALVLDADCSKSIVQESMNGMGNGRYSCLPKRSSFFARRNLLEANLVEVLDLGLSSFSLIPDMFANILSSDVLVDGCNGYLDVK